MISSGKLVFLTTFFALILQSLYVFANNSDEFMFVPFVLILAGVTSFFLMHEKGQTGDDANFQTNLFLWAFSLRLWAGMFFYGWGFSETIGDEDASGYLAAWTLAQNWYKFGLDGFLADIYAVSAVKTNVGQAFIWAIPTFIAGGPSRMIVSVFNSFAGSLLVLIIFRLTKRLFNSECARIAALLATFWPSFLLFSAGTSKEILFIFISWAILYITLRNQKKLTIKDGVLAAFLAFVMLTIRFYAFYMMVIAICFRFITASGKHLVRNLVLGTITIGIVIAFAASSGVFDRDYQRFEYHSLYMENWRKGVSIETKKGSGVDVYGSYESTNVAVAVAAAYFLFAPFPWEIFGGSTRNTFAVIENIVILFILVFSIGALRSFFRKNFLLILPVLIFCALYAGFHIWAMSNVGLAWRHKQTIMPLLFMLVALSISQSSAAWAMIIKRWGHSGRQLAPAPPRA
ncbi:MAG: glycosyltransferase family 39 protein [Pyrinomonadaceae bacterium]